MSVRASSDSLAPPTCSRRSGSWGLSWVADKGLVLVVILSLVLNVVGLSWGLPPSVFFAWDIDGIAPLQPLIAAKRMLIDDWWNSGYYNKYPMGHFFVLMAAYAPYLGYLWLTGGLRNPSEVYPFGFRDPETALTVLSLIARSISALMGVGIVVLVYLTARRLAGRRAALFSGLTVAFSPAFIFYAHTGNIDTPSLFWSALGLFAFSRLLAGQCEVRNYLLLGAAVGMAAATKEQTLGLFLLLPLSVLIIHVQHSSPAPWQPRALIRAVVEPRLLGGFAASIATFVVATHLVFNLEGTVLRFRWRLYGEHPSGLPAPPFTLDGIGAFGEIIVHTWEIMNPALFVAAVAGLVILPLRHRWARHFVVPLVSYVALMITLVPFFKARFVMGVALVLAFFVGPVIDSLWQVAAERSRLLLLPLFLVLVYSFVYGAEIDYLLVRDSRYEAERWFQTHVAAGAAVEAYSDPIYLPRFPRHVNVRHVLNLTAAELAGLEERAPDFLVLSSAYSRRWPAGSEEAAALASLLDGDFGYRPVGIFRREPIVSPRLIPGLSPEIVVLANHH